MLQGDITDLKEAQSLSFEKEYIDIYQISWGPDDDGKTFDGPGLITQHVLKDGVSNGRKGLGSVFVLASGTGGRQGDDCNADGYVSSIYTIGISSVDKKNRRPTFSEKCAAILATAYSGERKYGTGFPSAGIGSESCSMHDGTAVSASIATGIYALLLEVNPSLTWRDVQHITVESAQKDSLLGNEGWVENGAGFFVSHSFGFGLLDAEKMVEKARKWVQVAPQMRCETTATMKKENMKIVSVNCPEITRLEHVHLHVKIESDSVKRGNISISLTSPSNTKSIMMSRRINDKVIRGFDTSFWPLMSTHFWGENTAGEWTITDETKNTFSGAKFSIICYGTGLQT